MNRKERRATAKKRKNVVGAGLKEARRLREGGELPAAEALARKILAAEPQNAEARHELGLLALQAGQPKVAAEFLGEAIALRPSAEWENDLGIALGTGGERDAAMAAFRRAIAQDGGFLKARNNLGNLYLAQENFAEAKTLFEGALEQKPDYPEALNNLGVAELGLGDSQAAERAFRQATEARADYVDAHNNLGNVLKERAAFSKAEAAYRQAILCDPEHADAHNNLGSLLKDEARHDEAGSAFSRSLALGGGASAHSNALFCANFCAPAGAASYEAHVAWAKRHEGPAGPAHGNAPEEGRRLRVGYVSPDLRAHSVAFFLEPLLAAHDRDAVELFAYGRVARPDGVTARLRERFDHWRDISGWDAARLADGVRADGIDLLVDLAGHTAKNDLVAFGRKPAPVQLSWLGYPNTTGLAAMDYRLTDGLADPKGAEAHHREALLRLDGGFLCYRLEADLPPVGPLPMQACGQVTFGSFNQLAKLTDPVLAAWAGILRRVVGARLLLKARPLADAGVRAGLAARFAKLGIGDERLTLLGFAEDRAAHLAHYAAVDIALDPFPYNGTTTSFEALAMGVPVLSLEGASHAGRVGVSILRRLGLDDWLAADADAYVAAAAAFAARPEALATLRASLRPRLAASPLTDSARFAREVEAAYRSVWKKWCRQAKKAG